MALDYVQCEAMMKAYKRLENAYVQQSVLSGLHAAIRGRDLCEATEGDSRERCIERMNSRNAGSQPLSQRQSEANRKASELALKKIMADYKKAGCL